MKTLRVLTGIHAGASLRLTPGTHRIGSHDDADIRLTDWQGPDAMLEVGPADAVKISRELSDEEHAGTALLVDFVPMQFGESVLCIGPEDAAWPADVDLLSTLLASPVKSELASYQRQHQRRRHYTVVIICAVVGCVIAAVALLGATQITRAAFPSNAETRARRVTQALAASHVTGLHVQPLGNAVVVTGMAGTTGDDTTVRALLDRITPQNVQRRSDVAQDVVSSIQDSLGVPGVHVAYAGNGQFVISGKVSDKHALEAAVARVRADLDPNVKGLIVQAEEATDAAPDPQSATYSVMFSSDDVRYAETPDGVKHIFVVDQPAASPSDDTGSAALEASAPGATDATHVLSTAQQPVSAPAPASAPSGADAPAARGLSFPPLPDPGSLPRGAGLGRAG